ncbi:MAG: NACHT domain-containing protein [Leptolyngbya sp. SIO1E4]|nr:NACHT domain-containing protein [Leptolyngbya sp. SIO1E4]
MTSPTPGPLGAFEDPIAGGLTGIVLDIATKVGGAFIETVKDKWQAQAALKRYEAKYRQRYGSVRILGMRQDYPLEQVYTKVKFLDDLSIRRFESVEALEAVYRGKAKRRFSTRRNLSQGGPTVVNQHPKLTVLGQPGAGKSTFLRRVGLAAFGGQQKTALKFNCIPVFLELKRFNPTEIDLLGAVAKELSNFGFPETPEFASKALEQGKLLVLLDGLDEVPKDILNPAIEAIQDFVTRYDQNRFITSCRTAAHRSDFRGFTNVELADFDDEQIWKFIQRWFQSDLDKESNTAERCWNQLNDRRNRAAKELAQTPLLLTFLCLVYNRTQKFFDKRATLYRKALDILLEEWAADKRLNLGDIYEGLNTELEKVLLAEIAYHGFVNDQLFFTRQELIDQINEFVENTADKPTLPGKDILDAIAEQQGIFVERAEDVYSFSHLTLQEYLTAQYISEDPQLVSGTINDHLLEDRWREVFLLIPGLLRNADRYLLEMQSVTQRYLNTPKLTRLVDWADNATKGSPGNYKPAAKRVAAIFLARARDIDIALAIARARDIDIARAFARAIARAIASALTIARDIDIALALALDHASASASALEIAERFNQLSIFKSVDFSGLIIQLESFKKQISDNNRTGEDRQDLIDGLNNIWWQSLSLDPEIMKLSEEENKSLDHYFSTNRFILECKESAVRVSKDTWEMIEARMVTVWEE